MARYIDSDFVEYLIDHYGGMVTWNKKEILGEIRKRVQIHSTADVVPKSEVIAIFDELESTIDLIGAMVGLDIRLYGSYAELKKKYTEGEK